MPIRINISQHRTPSRFSIDTWQRLIGYRNLLSTLAAVCLPSMFWSILVDNLPANDTAVAQQVSSSQPTTERTTTAAAKVKFNMLDMPTTQNAQRRLMAPIRLLWSGQSLREGLNDLSRANQVAIWLDRRIDPGQAVTYSPNDAGGDEQGIDWPSGALGSRLMQLGQQLKIDGGLIEGVWYFGPLGEVPKIQCAAITFQDELHQAAPELARQLKPLRWDELSTPQQLLDQIAEDWGVEIDGALPHDLMHAGAIDTPIHLATQLMLLCGSFKLQPQIVSAKQIKLVPLNDATTWTANYPKSRIRTREAAAAQAAYPQSKARASGQSYELSGTTNFHLAMVQPAASNSRIPSTGKVTVWSFEIDKAPAEAIVANLATGIGLQVTWNSACTSEQKAQLLSLKVNQANLDQLLTQVCEAAGLRYTRDGMRVELFPK